MLILQGLEASHLRSNFDLVLYLSFLMPDAYTLKQHLSICSNIRLAHPLHYYQRGDMHGQSADRWQGEASWEAMKTEISACS